MIGNGFHCVTVALVLSGWAYSKGYLTGIPKVQELWSRAGYPYENWAQREYGYDWEEPLKDDSELREALGMQTDAQWVVLGIHLPPVLCRVGRSR